MNIYGSRNVLLSAPNVTLAWYQQAGRERKAESQYVQRKMYTLIYPDPIYSNFVFNLVTAILTFDLFTIAFTRPTFPKFEMVQKISNR
jgi:hypothetical protein